MSLLLDTVVADDDALKLIITDEGMRQISQEYLEQLLVNENLLSTDVFTSNSQSNTKTLTEEIAELDEQQRLADIKLSDITNDNRDTIIRISESLKTMNMRITHDIKTDVKQLLKMVDFDASLHPVNDHLNQSIGLNTSALNNIDSILDLLELPTLCKICILQGNYQEALDISILVNTLMIKYVKMPVFHKINESIKQELHFMVERLVKVLNTNLKQNHVLKIFTILNKLNLQDLTITTPTTPTTNTGSRGRFLKVLYFNSRFKFIMGELSTLVPLLKFNKLIYLKRYLEIYREFIFNSLSMFNTVFTQLNCVDADEDNLLMNQFIKNLFKFLVTELKLHLPELSQQVSNESELNGLILQIIYLCNSLSKFGQNLEPFLVWELCHVNQLIDESMWLNNANKIKSL